MADGSFFDDFEVNTVVRAGRVVYVGVPFGNAELLTLVGIRALSEADVVVLNSVSLAPLLDLPELALPERRVMTLDDYDGNQARAALVAREAGLGRLVVRLVGCDPMTDAAVGHEAHLVAQLGTSIDIVPSVSTLTAVPTYVGLDLTEDTPVYRHFSADTALPETGSLPAARWVISSLLRLTPLPMVMLLLRAPASTIV
jgi:siroheme synthase